MGPDIMANVVQQRGFFWWLNQPNAKTNSEESSVPGLLTISEEGLVKLCLDGALWLAGPPVPLRWGEPRPLARGTWITGRLGSGADEDFVLLDGLERTDFSIADETIRPQSYEAKICLTQDSPFSAEFSLDSFHDLRVELVGLEEWLNLNSIQTETVDYSQEEVEVRVKYRNHKFSFDVAGGNVSIESLTSGASLCGFLEQYQAGSVTFEQTNWLIWTPTSESSLDYLLYDFNRIEELFALLLGSYFQLDWPRLVKLNEDRESWCRLYFFRGSVPDFKPNHYFFWASFNDLRESFGMLFSAWKAQVEQYGAGYYLYLASLRNPLPYSEHRFVNLIWALESLHKRQYPGGIETPSAINRKARIESICEKLASSDDDKDLRWFSDRAASYQSGPKLSDRIIDSLSKLPITFEEGALHRFSMRCANRRNDISHEGGPREHETYHDFSEELSDLTEALSHLYHGFLLNEIGLDRKTLLTAMTKGGLAELRIMPALGKVGLDICKTAPGG